MRERRGQALAELLSRQICEMIIEDQLSPGDTLPTEARLVEKYAVSRGALREAIVRLRALGVVDVRHGHGTFVAALPVGILEVRMQQTAAAQDSVTERECVDFRDVLLTEAARLAALRGSDDDRIRQALQSVADARPGDRSSAINGFYERLGEACGNSIIAQLLKALSVILISKEATDREAPDPAAIVAPLADFEAAIREGKADMAAEAIRRHLNARVAA